MEAAKQSGGGTSEHIQKYGITDQTALKDIALESAKQNGQELPAYIENYEHYRSNDSLRNSNGSC